MSESKIAQKVEATNTCCTPAKQQVCCEPSEKSSCCGPEKTAETGTCGCQ